MLSKIKNKKRIILIIIGIILSIVGSVFFFKNDTKDVEAESVSYEEVKVKKDDIRVDMDSDGTIEFSKVNLRFGIKGTISEVLVNVGYEIKKGEMIAKLEDESFKDEYKIALAKLKDAKNKELTDLLNDEFKVKKLETELFQINDDYLEMEHIQDAYSANEIKMKKLELENKQLEYDNAVKNHQILIDNYESSEEDQNELAVKIAKENLEDTILYAPTNGVLISLDKKAGESVTDEQDIAVVHENNSIKAITNVIEYDINKIKLGQKVYVSVEAIPDKEFMGEVSKIDIVPTTDSSGIVSYGVEIDIKDSEGELRDGMTCMTSFILKEVNNCLIIPYKAVKMVEGKQVVDVLNKEGKVIQKEIKTGFTDGTNVEVTEGLEINDTVIVPSKSR